MARGLLKPAAVPASTPFIVLISLLALGAAGTPVMAQPPADPALPPPPPELKQPARQQPDGEAAPAAAPAPEATPESSPAAPAPTMAQPAPAPAPAAEPESATAAPQRRFFGDDERPPGAERPRIHYGGDLMIADATAALLVGGGTLFGLVCFANTFEIFSDNKPDNHWSCPVAVASLVLAGGAYAVAPPIIHAAHANPGGALASLALRIGLPALAIAVVAQTESPAAVPLVLGSIAGAMLLDWFVLAYTDAPSTEQRGVRPHLLATSNAIGLGVHGRL